MFCMYRCVFAVFCKQRNYVLTYCKMKNFCVISLPWVKSLRVRTCLADTPYEVCHVATELPAYQSSVYEEEQGNSYPASYAVDGSRETNLWRNSCVHSKLETNPWWAVDLGIPLTVTGVFFTNRKLARKSSRFRSWISTYCICIGSYTVLFRKKTTTGNRE